MRKRNECAKFGHADEAAVEAHELGRFHELLIKRWGRNNTSAEKRERVYKARVGYHEARAISGIIHFGKGTRGKSRKFWRR